MSSLAKLREHWDETSSAVLARKTQLDAMLSDSHKLETKRAEVEAWLTRMEHRLERSSMTVGLAPHMLDQQIRDQKGQQAEVQQYKHQMELLNQQTQRLITIYQHDDTRHLRRRGDALNARFNNLQANLAMRGKALHGAMNSTSNFDKALEKFFGWLSEAEASSNSADLDADNTQASTGSLGHRRDHGRHVATVKEQLPPLPSSLSPDVMDEASAQRTAHDELPALCRDGILSAARLGISGAALLGISGAALLGVSGAALLGVSGAALLGVLGAALLGISGAARLGISGAARLGISGAARLGISDAARLGISGYNLLQLAKQVEVEERIKSSIEPSEWRAHRHRHVDDKRQRRL
ncbi:hypothetical protein HAZT_HAZT010526 [Hyalella azteca]|uniref:Uncharacterized protein n=1 Tax=Hyalella azteca TaxID=294128 RepID=A0A6A0HDS2_HYAAZ|nr:hypothetical protein HAZT_HAZT010526 [Hyalella azteca]